MEEKVTRENIKNEFPNLTEEEIDLIVTWVENAYDAGYDQGAENANWSYH